MDTWGVSMFWLIVNTAVILFLPAPGFQSTGDCTPLDIIVLHEKIGHSKSFENIKWLIIPKLLKIGPHICFLVSTILFLICYGFIRNKKKIIKKEKMA